MTAPNQSQEHYISAHC